LPSNDRSVSHLAQRLLSIGRRTRGSEHFLLKG